MWVAALGWLGCAGSGSDSVVQPVVLPVVRLTEPLFAEPPAEPIHDLRFQFAWTWPVVGPVSSGFGRNRGDHRHTGVDILAPRNTPVVAAGPGMVCRAGWYDAYGRTVDIAHPDGHITRYAHLEQIGVSIGQWINPGIVIGLVGSSGRATTTHLHFELREGGHAIDPMSLRTAPGLVPTAIPGPPLDLKPEPTGVVATLRRLWSRLQGEQRAG
ncbi:MAG: M23 family metallopeptidase [Myxococcota bacterium]